MNRTKKAFDCLVFLIVTVGGIGKIKYAPGTFGSLAAFPFGYIYAKLVVITSFYFLQENFEIQNFTIILLTFTIIYFLLFFFIGLIFCKFYLKNSLASDPSEVVIDELVGQLLTFILCFITFPFFPSSIIQEAAVYLNSIYIVLYIITPFILFRLFDILKPWPINWIDRNVKGALGVMLDDIMAAILAAIMNWSLFLIITDYIAIELH